MERIWCLFIVCALFSCTSSTSRLMGSLSEPRDIEVAVPFRDTDAVPLLYGFVSDSFENAIFPLNLSLRKFIESDVPYFPMRIPVGRYPTKISADRSQKRLFVLNYLDKTISVIDTVNLIERGFGEYRNNEIIYSNGDEPYRKYVGLFVSDMKVVYNQFLKKEFLIVVGSDMDFKGRVIIIDIDEKDIDGVINKDFGKVLFNIELDIFPASIAVSEDGDEVYIGSKSSKRFALLDIAGQGIYYISSDLVPDLLRLNQSKLYIIDTSGNRFAVFDINKREFEQVLPYSIFGNLKVQPLQTYNVRDMAFSPRSDLGGVINTLSKPSGCIGTVAFMINAQGNIFVIDVDGCSLCEEADSDKTRVPCRQKGWYNLPVEGEITQPTVSRPILQIESRVLNYNEQGLAEYPFIDRWDNSDRNFGIGISRLFRANMFGREIQISYEGVIIEGTGSIIEGKFVPDYKGFENFNITNLDIIDLRDINGNPLRHCEDKSLVEKNEFRIVSVSSDGIEVDGNLPKDDCLTKYLFFVRPFNGWTVHIDGYGFLGRAYENQTFELKDDQGISHLKFTLKSGKNTSIRGMKFISKIFIYPYGISPGEKMITPVSIKIAQDSIDKDRYFGFVVYTGSKSIWQFSSRDLDANSSIVYR